MTLRLQTFLTGIFSLITALLLGLGNSGAKIASGGYPLFEPVALEHQHAIHLTSLENFDHCAKVASECCNAPNNVGEVFTGGRILSRMDTGDWDLAEHVYNQIRLNGDDVARIAENTGLSQGAIARAKEHLFINRHQLDDGIRRFDADPEIANAWNRLENGTHTAADIDLINHERFEAILMQRYGQPYRCAHVKANACGFQSPID